MKFTDGNIDTGHFLYTFFGFQTPPPPDPRDHLPHSTRCAPLSYRPTPPARTWRPGETCRWPRVPKSRSKERPKGVLGDTSGGDAQLWVFKWNGPAMPVHRPGGRDAFEGKGHQRRPERRLGRRLEEDAKAVGGGYCRLQMPLTLALGMGGTAAGRRLGALEGGGGGGRQIRECEWIGPLYTHFWVPDPPLPPSLF